MGLDFELNTTKEKKNLLAAAQYPLTPLMLRCKLNQSTFEKGLKTFTEITCEVSSGLQEDDMVLVSPHYMQVPIGNFVFSSAHFRFWPCVRVRARARV